MLAPHSQAPTSRIPPPHTYIVRLTLLPNQYAAAKYYRLAEQNGNKTLGNSW